MIIRKKENDDNIIIYNMGKQYLGSNLKGKNYNYNFMRFIASIMVILSHAKSLSLGTNYLSSNATLTTKIYCIVTNGWGSLAVAFFLWIGIVYCKIVS